jgi:hypothetical protein
MSTSPVVGYSGQTIMGSGYVYAPYKPFTNGPFLTTSLDITSCDITIQPGDGSMAGSNRFIAEFVKSGDSDNLIITVQRDAYLYPVKDMSITTSQNSYCDILIVTEKRKHMKNDIGFEIAWLSRWDDHEVLYVHLINPIQGHCGFMIPSKFVTIR